MQIKAQQMCKRELKQFSIRFTKKYKEAVQILSGSELSQQGRKSFSSPVKSLMH